MKKNRFIVLLLAILTALGLLNVSLALADGGSVDAELQADAAAGAAVEEYPSVEGGLNCAPGEIPIDIYYSDFELDGGGWTITATAPTGDGWEHGPIVTGTYAGCDTAPRPEPAGAHSGSSATGTNLDGCYPNMGGEMYMEQTFDLSGVTGPVEMSYWQWHEVFESFDWAKVLVNGDELWRTPGSAASADWTYNALDLSAYAGNSSVNVQFELHATTVVNRMGWYVDDVALTTCGEPTIEVTKTVGTDAAACAAGSSATVVDGAPVYYCITVQNTSPITMPLHDASDSDLGTLLSGFAYDLSPGETLVITNSVIPALGPVVHTADTTGVLTWTAGDFDTFTATDTSTTTVTVTAPTDVALTGFGDAGAAGGPGLWLWLVAIGVPLLGGALLLRRRQMAAS